MSPPGNCVLLLASKDHFGLAGFLVLYQNSFQLRMRGLPHGALSSGSSCTGGHRHEKGVCRVCREQWPPTLYIGRLPQEVRSLSFPACCHVSAYRLISAEIPLSEPSSSPETEALPQTLKPDEGLTSHSEERGFYGLFWVTGPQRTQKENRFP